MALVTCNGQVMGGGLLTARPSPPWAVLSGATPRGPILTGQVYGLAPSQADSRRAFIHSLLQATFVRGFTHLSLGEDHAWMQAAYAKVVIEKLEWASAMVFERSDRVLVASFENCNEDVLYFKSTDTGLELCTPRPLMELSDRLRAGIARLRSMPHDQRALASLAQH